MIEESSLHKKSFTEYLAILFAKKPVRYGSVGALLLGVIITSIVLINSPALSASFTWTQTDWTGGSDGGTGATNPTDQTGWNKFSSITNVSGTTSPGNAVLASADFTATDDGTLTTTGSATGGGFANGTTSSTTVSGSGAGASVALASSLVPGSFAMTTPAVPGPVGAGGLMIRNGADDDVYIIQGNNNTGFFKYSTSGNSWTILAAVPSTVGSGSKMLRNGSSNDIYLLGGNDGTGFFKYSISANSWTTLAVVPASVGIGGTMLRNGSDDDIYVLRGGVGPFLGTTDFYKYSISGNSWTTLASVPGTVRDGGSMLRNGSDNDIYVLRGGLFSGTTDFFKYSISGNSWTTLAAVPGQVSNGGLMMRNGADDDIYVIQGSDTNNFYRYSIVGNSWTTLADTPLNVLQGSGMMRNGADDEIYAFLGATTTGRGTTGFYKYSISGNSWTTLQKMPNLTNVGSVMIRNGADNDIYVLHGNTDTSFNKYSISGNSWSGSGVSPFIVPALVGAGGTMIRNGSDDDIYVLQGNSGTGFFRYSISGNSWTTLATVPSSIGLAGNMIRNGSDDEIYVLRGNSSADFFKYSISGNSWTTLTVLPSAVGEGAKIIRNSDDNDIYVLRGGVTNSFFKYSISGNSWTTLAVVPGTVRSGSGMIRNAADNDIYVLRGSGTSSFFKYSISGNSWTTLTVIPSNVGNGANMIRNGSDNDIYLIRAGTFSDFYKYSISGNSWSSLTSVPGGNSSPGSDSTLMRNGSDDDIYFIKGSESTGFYKYSVSGNSWTTLVNIPGPVGSASSGGGSGGKIMRNASDNQIYILQGNVYANLWLFTIDTAIYLTSGTFTSAVIDTQGTTSLGDLSWSQSLPASTTLTFATRTGNTATPDGTWSSFSSELSTAAGSPITSPAARYIQYRGTFGTSNTANTPALNNLTVAYSAIQLSGNLVSSSFNSTDTANVISGISWIEDAALPAGTSVTVSLRTATSSGGLTGTWSDFTNATTSCTKSTDTVTCANAAIPASLKTGGDDQFIQYKIALTTTSGLNTATVGSVSVINGLSSSGSQTGTINVLKKVINDNVGTKTVADFPLFVNNTAVTSGVTNSFPAPAGLYVISETNDANYTRTFSGDCDVNGAITLNPNDSKFCVITNDDNGAGTTGTGGTGTGTEGGDASLFDETGLTDPYHPPTVVAGHPSITVDKTIITTTSSFSCASGSTIKLQSDNNPETQNDSTVYYCGPDGKRYVFPSAKVYFSWYANFNDVLIMSNDSMASLPIGGTVTERPGTRMVKLQSNPQVYVLARGGTLRAIPDEATAKALYGENWATLVLDLPEVFLTNYKVGNALPSRQ